VTESLHCAHSHVKSMSMWNPNNGTSLHSATSSLALGMPLQATACHVTSRDATPQRSPSRPHSTTLPRLSTTLNNDLNKPIPDSPSLPSLGHEQLRSRHRVTFTFFTHEGSGTHFCPFLVDLAPYPYRSENKRKLLLQIAGIMQAQTMRDGADSCRTPLRFP
jgi:hypothetical protein